MTHGEQAGHLIILSNNSHTWVLIHIRAHIYTHIYTHSCADIHLHTHVRTYIYSNTYTHYPLYLVYLCWSNKSPRKQLISITDITILNTTYTHIFPYNFFFFTAIAKLWSEELFILSGSSVLVSSIVLCDLCRMQFCVCCILVTLAGIISPCPVSWSCWSALDVKLNI